MTDSDPAVVVAPHPSLQALDVLVGTWRISGPTVSGTVRFEWLEGGFFLVQHFDLMTADHPVKGIEIIGVERDWSQMDAAPPGPNDRPALKSHSFDNQGNSFTYEYEMDGDDLIIWGGEKGSPAYFRGTFDSARTTNTGAWVWPGGGYESNMTRES